MNALLILLSLVSQDVLTPIEVKLEEAFDDATYRRYLYYCRQQNEGSRLAAHSEQWLQVNPEKELLRFGRAEGLLMSENQREGLNAFRELYRSSPAWLSEIVFTLNELEISELPWFIEEERKRTGNRTLYADMLVNFYLEGDKPRKALDELGLALKSGKDSQSYIHEISVLSDILGKERVFSELRNISPGVRFQLALGSGNEREMKSAIVSSTSPSELINMGNLAEKGGYLDQALLAFQKAGDVSSEARVLVALDRFNEARELLSEDDSPEGQEKLAMLLSRSKETYAAALELYKELERKNGARTRWSSSAAALELLSGDINSARKRLAGMNQDSTVLFLNALASAASGEYDSIKRFTDLSMVRYSGSSFENDLLLLYEVSLSGSESIKGYSLALTAYHWGDPSDTYQRSIRLASEDTTLADETLLLAAESLARLGRWKEADDAYKKIYEDWPKSPLSSRAQFERAMLLRNHLDSPQEAKSILEEIIRSSPSSLYADYARREL